MQVVVVDNGAHTLRAGLATDAEPAARVPNCVARAKKEKTVLVGDGLRQHTRTHDLALHRAHERGYVVNWDVERAVWDRVACLASSSSSSSSAAASDAGLLLTEAPLCPAPLRRTTLQVVFEELGFAAHLAAVPAALALRRHLHLLLQQQQQQPQQRRAALVIDAGFSFMHAVPCACGGRTSAAWARPLAQGVRRVDVGGKALTNLLKEVVSFRHWNMMEETLLVGDIKERLAFVSLDFARDMRAPPPAAHYLLPDYSSSAVGAPVASDAEAAALKAAGKQILSLGIERFTVPEVLFNPSDVGIDQCGIADAAAMAVEACPAAELDQLWSCVLVRGGTSLIPGFAERLESELRALAPEMCHLSVVHSKECDHSSTPLFLFRSFLLKGTFKNNQPGRCLERRETACGARRVRTSSNNEREVQRNR